MRSLRVATFNIQHGRGPDGRVDLDRFARAVATLDVDILGLQEVDVGVPRSHLADVARIAAVATGMHVSFGAATAIDGGQYGNALLTRELPDVVDRLALPGREGREPRAALLARVGGVSVAATHLSVGADQHVGQLETMRAALVEYPSPRVLLGDLNHETPALAGFTLAGGPPTFPAHRPRSRIDHVATDGLEIEAVDVVALPRPYEGVENSATISRASSSRYCTGGDFMK
jgi:endonuclease/exonuclease/phosphatase family metal-dependent hydrolase